MKKFILILGMVIVCCSNSEVKKTIVVGYEPTAALPSDQKLLQAAHKGDLAGVQAALAAGANVNATSERGQTALMLAAPGGYTEIARVLIEAKANVNAHDGDGTTALMIATNFINTVEMVKLLIKAKANVNARTKGEGVTALMLASANGFEEIVTLLLKAKANVNARDKSNGTALSHAHHYLYRIGPILKAAGAKY